jgi:acyl-coenzyme A thioesterase PaaI-like protein
MGLADTSFYVALLGVIGPKPLAVTTNLNINFMRKAPPGDIIADVHLMKVGQRLAVGEVTMHRAGDDEVIAHCVATYSIPPNAGDMANGD